MREEWRWVQDGAAHVARRARQHDPLPGARAGDVTVIALAAQLLLQVGSELNALLLQFRALGGRQQDRGSGGRGKHRLVHAEHERQFQVGIARPVDLADQHLIQRGRNDSDRQRAQTRLQDQEPLAQWQGFRRERPLDVVQPCLHLLPDGRMTLALRNLDAESFAGRRFRAPRRQLLFDLQPSPQLSQGRGELRAGWLQGLRPSR